MTEEVMALAKLRLEELLTFFGINTKVQAIEDGETVNLEVAGDSSSGLIGHRGETLRSIQYLINQIVRNQSGERAFISVDIGGYKKSRNQYLTTKAQAVAEKVASSGQAETLRPMTAAERRIVHLALADVPAVETESAGEEPHRRITIKKRDLPADTPGE